MEMEKQGRDKAKKRCRSNRQGLQRFVKLRDEAADQVFIALEEDPLAYLAGSDQAGALQRGQMRRHGGLGKSCALIDQASTNAQFERIFLHRKMRRRIFQPGQDLAT